MWLVSPDVRQLMEQAQQSGLRPTAQQALDYEAAYASSSGGIAATAGSTVQIKISGVLTKAPDLMAKFFGGGNVTYGEITTALAEAEADPSVKQIELRVDSPGGSIDGLFDTVAALQAAKKPIRAVIDNVAASAAYALVSQADEIVAANRAVRVGSIGVVASFFTSADVVQVTSTAAPKKRPDVTTDEGKEVVREELDALHSLFVEAISAGRKVKPEKINERFGQGSVLLADEALKRGMIDKIAGPALQIVKDAETQANTELDYMDLQTLKEKHAGVYAAAMADGAAQERDRVVAHITMGEASGDMKTALEAIADGSQMTAGLQAKYMAAGLNRRDVQNRQADDAAAAVAADGAAAEQSENDIGSKVLALVEKSLGITE